ncbi:hypothetical protein MAC_08029 [Metarhizium acridum CQMa 102]|uniref:Uncharacterized protein n=1 Tax=Metarhizium acridum (strain CQMa 102) TaxID=655827 RepID=E9EDT1_METAQ|nr:uncharacterized protein MAC_08029 [Metarhizium acridum CQMa 102]EFY85946.1 hypothetical protein MAC_08029 [Metarhizium acridum CQMa 102]
MKPCQKQNNPDRKPRIREGLPESVNEAARLFVSIEESEQILAQLQQACVRNKQVLWSGISREVAQGWADKHHLQTLTTVMGPLMDIHDPRCPRRHKGHDAWSAYVHGASVLFAWYIAGGDIVTVLSQPPPQRFNPTGEAYYQTVEEPIITGKLCDRHAKILSEDVAKQLTGPLSSDAGTRHVNAEKTIKKNTAGLEKKENLRERRQVSQTKPVKKKKKKVRKSQKKGKEGKQKAQDKSN